MGFFDFLDQIGSVFADLSKIINILFAALWNAMRAALQWIWDQLVAFAQFLHGIFLNIGKFFARSWTDYLKPAIRGLFNNVIKLFDRLHRLLAPLLKWIQKIRQWYDTHILPILMKEIQMIQRVRQFLAVLRILHVKWAQVLDDKLASIQGKITRVVETVRGILNEIINFFAIVSNPILLIGSLTHSAWVVNFFDTVLRALTGAGLSSWLGRTDLTGIGSRKSGKFSTLTRSMNQDFVTGTGDFHQIGLQAAQTLSRFDADLT
jgi:hypothetical protein